jgi:hypothetical protein
MDRWSDFGTPDIGHGQVEAQLTNNVKKYYVSYRVMENAWGSKILFSITGISLSRTEIGSVRSVLDIYY